MAVVLKNSIRNIGVKTQSRRTEKKISNSTNLIRYIGCDSKETCSSEGYKGLA